MAKEPRVTVVIPTYNRAALVVEAIESVLRQSYRDLEIVVSDDGSTDNTAARVNAFGAPVRHLALSHGGRLGRTRNRGIEAARGELIAFLDDDDLWETNKLAAQIAVMDREGANFVYCDRRVHFDDKSPSARVTTPAPASPDRLLDVVVEGHFPSMCTLLVDRALLQQAGSFDETLVTGEDLDLCLRLAPIARAACVPEPLVIVRRRPESLSERCGPLTYQVASRLFERSLATGGLLPRQRRRCRATLSRLNIQLAAMLAERGDRPEAAMAFGRAASFARLNLSTWAGLAGAVISAVRRS